MPQPVEDPRWIPADETVRRLGREFDTPLYAYHEGHFRIQIERYRSAWQSVAARTRLTFASKANSTLAILKIAHQHGCLIDTASEGELRAALAAGIPASDCHLHGNNKSRTEIGFALQAGIGQIVADNIEELQTIAAFDTQVPIVLRLAPGVLPITNTKISTGQEDTKFGFNVQDGTAERGLLLATDLGLNVVGFHCHVGSQLLDPEAQMAAASVLAAFARQMQAEHGFITQELNLGGGRAVRYTDETPIPILDHCHGLAQAVRNELEGSNLDPVLIQEPGRSLIAESGVTIYTVGTVKQLRLSTGRIRRYVSVDGGLADNPRPSLYGARYEVRAVSEHGGSLGQLSSATVVGSHCEPDILFDDVQLPDSIGPGDYLVVLTTGAYSASMASNYNRFRRPASVLVQADSAELIQRRETFDEMLAREVLPDSL